MADNPHTNVERAFWRAYLNSAPVRFEWFAEGLYIVRAREDASQWLGQRVVAIAGKSPELIVRDASKYFGGPPEHGRVSSLLVMESPAALHVLYPDVPDDRLELALDDGKGGATKVALPAVDPKEAPKTIFQSKPPVAAVAHARQDRQQRTQRKELRRHYMEIALTAFAAMMLVLLAGATIFLLWGR